MRVITLILIAIFLNSCASTEQSKVKVTSSTSELETSVDIEDDVKSNEGELDDEYLSSVETPTIKVKEDILAEKLIEVGDRVFFDYDKSSFRDKGIETLKRQAEFLLLNKETTITIEGHCDERGTSEYNLALGERRASSVKNYLVSLGVSPDRISVLSYGKEKPPVIGNNEYSWSQSRTAITVINRN